MLYDIQINFSGTLSGHLYLWTCQEHRRDLIGLEASQDHETSGLKAFGGRWSSRLRRKVGASYPADHCEMAGLDIISYIIAAEI